MLCITSNGGEHHLQTDVKMKWHFHYQDNWYSSGAQVYDEHPHHFIDQYLDLMNTIPGNPPRKRVYPYEMVDLVVISDVEILLVYESFMTACQVIHFKRM